MYLKKIKLLREKISNSRDYPFSISSIKNLDELNLTKAVTFFVGENGSGKSTLLEGIADKCDFNVAGGGRSNIYDVHASQSALGDYLRLGWMPKIGNGFFLRAESFYQFASHLDQLKQDDPSYNYDRYGGRSLHEQSHGESFLSLFKNRFEGKALYLLDEPEAALSPARQLAFLRVIHDLATKNETQFIIATHSPILLGYPDADIYSFDEHHIDLIDYEMTDHYQITHYFLQNRERMLWELLKEET
ncbi:AAA family ATPase [Alkalicoccobacillus porphyridii]|uniref:AAA family ATPase n=1 Tax=Alkalicoccobacillus porphyridii TaxID=2597270 RepID=A0A553ZX94_9BACI|nr:AAA family ATPase [Alkalicoccobacillus porphyridii]TSB46054.1 AAA family ATPase [Alkalicoccobacillus porphyridii]